MSDILVFVLLAMIAVFAVVAKWLNQPYPIVFLMGGIALAFVPGMPSVQLAPELVFLVFLPPLIFGDGFVTDWRDFKRYIEPISMLATGLVVATSVTVAWVGHELIGLPWTVGFVLGAILSPTDTVATDAIAEATALPRRIEVILGGESLVNDATALVIYKFAIGAVLAGSFSLGGALLQFVYVAMVGVAIGIIGGELLVRVGRWLFERDLTDDTISTVITLVTPYLVYLAADRAGASGVLAAAAGGVYISRKGGGFYTANSRIIGRAVWNTLFFLFNGTLFVILGLQLRSILSELQIFPAQTLTLYGGAVASTVIVSRLIWVWLIARGRRLIDRKNITAREGPPPSNAQLLVLGWAGMRGIVSLAAALAIPREIAPGVPFPARDLILFVTFVVILVTLIGQGFTLPLLIRALNVSDAEAPADAQVEIARLRVADAGLKRLEALEAGFASVHHWEIASKLRARFEEQLLHAREHVEGAPDEVRPRHELTRKLLGEVLAAQRNTLLEMRHHGEIGDVAFRRVQYDIDLEESLLD